MELTADVIQGFTSSLLQKSFDGAVESPECHYDWWKICTSKHPQVAIAAPRRHAKSTAITLSYALCCLTFRERQYVVILSDTVTQATLFLNDLKQQLVDNDRLRDMFGIQKFLKESEDDIIVQCTDGHKFRVVARGAEQKMRGLKWENKRPDLIICDDLENDEIVMNKERRDKFKRWFYGAVIPCISKTGIIRVVGTILHEDSLLNNLMPKDYRKGTVVDPLITYSKERNPAWLSLKYRAHTDDFSKILWHTNYDKEYFVKKRNEFIDQGIPDVYSQEYLNVPIDDSVAYFKKADFTPMQDQDKKKRIHYYVTADLAISEKETADYSVFVVSGVDEDKIIQVRNVIRDRLDGREIVDTLISLQRIYQPEAVGIEEMQVSKAIGPFLREEMIKTGVFLNLVPMKHGGKDKIQRARSIQARMRARGVKFDKSGDWYPTFEDELTKFPRSQKDDQVDAFAYLGLMLDMIIEAPTQQEINEEEYLDELRQSDSGESGRSNFTGY